MNQAPPSPPAVLSDAERLACERFLIFALPKAREGDRYAIRNGYWRVVNDHWVPEAEYFAQREAELAVAREMEQLNMEAILEDGARAERIREATPAWDDLKHEIPGLNVIEHPDGTKSCDFNDTSLDGRHKLRLGEMFGERRDLEAEQSDVSSQRIEDDSVPVGAGRYRRKVLTKHAEKADQKLWQAARAEA